MSWAFFGSGVVEGADSRWDPTVCLLEFALCPDMTALGLAALANA